MKAKEWWITTNYNFEDLDGLDKVCGIIYDTLDGYGLPIAQGNNLVIWGHSKKSIAVRTLSALRNNGIDILNTKGI